MSFLIVCTVPYLLCRLDEPGIRSKCILQFNSAPLKKHDKVTQYMMRKGTPFRKLIDEMNEDGTGMGKLLKDECDSIGTSPLVTAIP